MNESIIGALHLVRLLRQLVTHRWARRRLVERGARRLGYSRKRAEGFARRVP